MKKLILTWIMVLMVLQSGAAPARRGMYTITQPDGTTVRIEQFGDEHHHWTATADGTLVVNTQRGCYVAQIDGQGRIAATDVLAHESSLRQEAERNVIQQQITRRALFHQRGEEEAARRSMSISTNGGYLPHMGSIRIPVIMVEFQDVTFTVNSPLEAFEQFFNGEKQLDLGNHNTNNIASVRQYFEYSSDGQFTPLFDIVGIVKLPNKMAYYGGSSGTGSDDKFSELCSDALAQVKQNNLVTDWSLYDNDGDNKVEVVGIIFAGYGQNQGGANETIWAKASKMNMKIDSQYSVNFFNCSCELDFPDPKVMDYINGTGVFIHELSHCMGLPDIYVTNTSAIADNQSMEAWDLMDYGLYCKNGWAPAPYLAWQRQVMGWCSIEALEQSMENLTLYPMSDTENGKAYMFQNTENNNEFIVLENIQQQSLNKHAYGHGLLVYHVAYPSSVINFTDNPNNTKGRPAVASVPAGGLQISNMLIKRDDSDTNPYTRDEWKTCLAAVPFPGTKNITSLDSNMELPNYLFYVGKADSKAVGFSLNNITEDSTTGNITLNVVKESKPDGIEVLKMNGAAEYQNADGMGQNCYNLSGQRVSHPTRGFYIVNGRKLVKK